MRMRKTKQTSEESEDDVWKREPGLRKHKDVGSAAILLFLYTLQGVPMGLAGSIPLLLQSQGATYTDQAC